MLVLLITIATYRFSKSDKISHLKFSSMVSFYKTGTQDLTMNMLGVPGRENAVYVGIYTGCFLGATNCSN